MSQHVVIERRFNGPPDSGHGGYVCGLVARLVGNPTQVTLRRPPPLDRPLSVRPWATGGVEVMDGDTVVAQGVSQLLEVTVPEPVTFEDAQTAARGYPGFAEHSFPTCFACGPLRPEGDGLRIFPGQVRDMLAAPWVPHPSLADEEDRVSPEFLWAALDCPSGWAVLCGPGTGGRPILLGQLTVHVMGSIRSLERCVVGGWMIHAEGRKGVVGAAVWTDSGRLVAAGKAVWVRPR